MEYAIDQPVIYEYPLSGCRGTGKIVGHSGEHFIISLDKPLRDGTRAMLVHSEVVRPLSCHWCLDTQKVYATPVTGAQIASGDIPKVDCPCVRSACTCCKDKVR